MYEVLAANVDNDLTGGPYKVRLTPQKRDHYFTCLIRRFDPLQGMFLVVLCRIYSINQRITTFLTQNVLPVIGSETLH